MSDVAVVVLDLDGGDLLAALAGSLERQTLLPARLIVWDNGSLVPVRGRITTTLPLELGRSETNLGFTGGINEAMRLVTEPFVAWINNDVELDPRWLETLRRTFDEPRLGAVQAVQGDGEGRIDGAGVEIGEGTIQQVLHGAPHEALMRFEQPWGVSATAALYRLEALRDAAIDGNVLHPAFFAYYEDVELCARLRARGWSMRVVPELLATHRGSQSAGRLGEGAFLRVRNRYLVHRLHAEVGRTSSLLLEDARSIGRSLLHGKLTAAMTTIRGAWAGLVT